MNIPFNKEEVKQVELKWWIDGINETLNSIDEFLDDESYYNEGKKSEYDKILARRYIREKLTTMRSQFKDMASTDWTQFTCNDPEKK